MFKRFCLQLFTLFTVFLYGQDITFEKNVSYTARKLKLTQQLNESGDSLILESKKKEIRRVDILNDEYMESIDVNSNKGEINLKNIPVGSYVIQAKLGRHWIVMYMEKKEAINTKFKKREELNPVAIKDKSSKENILFHENDSNEINFMENTLYWVVYESNSRFASNKTMGLKYVDEINDLISKIQLELKSEVGKYNKLLVYEIYNKKKFMKKQYRNRKYYKSKRSKFFNVLPIYSSEVEKKNNSQS